MTAAEALVKAVRIMADAGVDGAPRDARLLLAHALGVGADRLTLLLHDTVPTDALVRFGTLVANRASRVPVAYLIERRQFFGRDFIVTPAVLDPRGDTETLIEAALVRPFARLLDLGTGSGAIALTLLAERPGTTGIATDVSRAALDVAGRNAAGLGVADRIAFAQSDWFSHVTGPFDLIVSNPPYIAASDMQDLSPEVLNEPREALTDEGDGLSAYRAITTGAGAQMTPGGRLLVEIGATQGQTVTSMFKAAGFAQVAVIKDIDGRDRCVSGDWAG